MTTISFDNPVVTYIDTFTVTPQNQQRALELLVEVTQRLRREVPGFLSANFHKSVDGMRLVNYAQYDSREAVQAVTAKIMEWAEVPTLVELRRLATPDLCRYELCAIEA
jgi:quinol monooxygenase YgiN